MCGASLVYSASSRPVRGYTVRPDLKNKCVEILVGPREWLSVRKHLFSRYTISSTKEEGGDGKRGQLQCFMAVTLNNAGLGSHFDAFCFDIHFGCLRNKQVTSQRRHRSPELCFAFLLLP